MPTDRFDQYHQDVRTITPGSRTTGKHHSIPTRINHPSGTLPSLVVVAVAFRVVLAAALLRHKDRSELVTISRLTWDRSEERAERLRPQVQGQQPWTGSPDDYNDVIGPDRSGGMSAVTMGPRQVGIHPDGNGNDWGGAGVRAKPKPTNGNGNGLSGGAAQKIPTEVGGNW